MKNIIQEIFIRLIRFYRPIESIYPVELKLRRRDKVLVLAPHPDDEVMGCGGLLSKYSTNCDVVFLTDGRHGAQDSSSPIEMALIRKKEAQSVFGTTDQSHPGVHYLLHKTHPYYVTGELKLVHAP